MGNSLSVEKQGRAAKIGGQSLFNDTIFALSSGGLPSGVAVIRLSGALVRTILAEFTGSVPAERRAVLRTLKDRSGQQLDTSLVLFFPGPRSFTGEDCAELHLHGGKATVAAVLDTLSIFEGSRQAEPGEFTRRAFHNGKIDLTGTEALADLVAAETEQQRRMALANVGGRQRELYDSWRVKLIRSRALIEAELDFADEADVPGSVSDHVWADLSTLQQEIVDHIDGFRSAEIIREGFRVALIGPPNVGKSSLLNALARRDVAIVTDIPGTTRDLVEVTLDIGGVKVIVTDTAGLRETADIVEKIGVERALAAAERADLVLTLIDLDDAEASPPIGSGIKTLRVATKSDLRSATDGAFDHLISSVTGEGLPELIDAIGAKIDSAIPATEGAVPSRVRHVQHLKLAIDHLHRAIHHINVDLELRAEELRLASGQLGRIVGKVDVEDLLDVIFSEFCIGK